MKREKIFCLCIAVLLVFGLAGCGTERKDERYRECGRIRQF